MQLDTHRLPLIGHDFFGSLLTSSFRFSHRPHGLSSKISLSSSESSPLSLGDLCSDSLLLDRLPGMAQWRRQLDTQSFRGESPSEPSTLKLLFSSLLLACFVAAAKRNPFYDNFTNKKYPRAYLSLPVSPFIWQSIILFLFRLSYVLQPHEFRIISMKKISSLMRCYLVTIRSKRNFSSTASTTNLPWFTEREKENTMRTAIWLANFTIVIFCNSRIIQICFSVQMPLPSGNILRESRSDPESREERAKN